MCRVLFVHGSLVLHCRRCPRDQWCCSKGVVTTQQGVTPLIRSGRSYPSCAKYVCKAVWGWGIRDRGWGQWRLRDGVKDRGQGMQLGRGNHRCRVDEVL